MSPTTVSAFIRLSIGLLTLLHRLPHLDPGPSLPTPYFTKTRRLDEAPTLRRDPDVEHAERSAPPVPKVTPRWDVHDDGSPVTRKERKEVRFCPAYVARDSQGLTVLLMRTV